MHFLRSTLAMLDPGYPALGKAGFLRRESNPEDKRTCRLFPHPAGPGCPPPDPLSGTPVAGQVMEPFSPEEREIFLTSSSVGSGSSPQAGPTMPPGPLSLIGKEEEYGGIISQ